MNFCVFGNPSVRPLSADQMASPATKSYGPRNPWVRLFLVFFRDFIEHSGFICKARQNLKSHAFLHVPEKMDREGTDCGLSQNLRESDTISQGHRF